MRAFLIVAALGLGASTVGCGGGGGGNSGSNPPEPTVTLSLNPASIKVGQSATLTWSSTDATACTASGAWSGARSTSGTQSVTPSSTGNNTYTLTCSGAGGGASASKDLSVTPADPKATISVNPGSIVSGESATLTWSSTDATSCTAAATPASAEWSGTVPLSGTRNVMPNVSTSYKLTCSAGSSSDSHTVNVTVAAQQPTITISVNPTTINLGQQPPATLSWSTTGGLTTCTASGTDSAWTTPAAKGVNGTQSVTPPAGTSTYILNCTNADGSAHPNPASASLRVKSTIANVVEIAVDGGPPAAGHTVNLPYISVTLCLPGPEPQTCKTIDHVDVDTASFGVRIVASALSAAPALNLAQQFDVGGDPVAECVQFLTGYTWGSVRLADVKLAGEIAHNLPIQIIGDLPDASVPSACSSVPPALKTAADIGSNGIIGVGPFILDCPGCATQALEPHYYGCPFNGACAPITQALANQVQNPVAQFLSDNNGTIVDLRTNTPTFPDTGGKNIKGQLIFGIGTQDNNTAPAVLIPLNAFGNFTTDDPSKVKSYPNSFIDSGSNGFFLPAAFATLHSDQNPDPPIPVCVNTHTDFYCPSPASPLNIPVLNRASAAQFGTGVGATVAVANAQSLFATGNDAFKNLAGPLPAVPNLGLDFGLSFFFEKRVFTAIEDKPTPGVTPGPFVAY